MPTSLSDPPYAASALLESGFTGEVLTTVDGERYDAARAVFNAMFDRRPGLVARARSEHDVVVAVRHAVAHGLPLAVKSGGHSIAGFSSIEDGMLLDLGPMRRIDVDPPTRTVRVQPGVTWGELDRATQEHGLATTGGRMTTTGVPGFVLGSGSGWLERLCGLACDNLVSARLVTAAGEIVTASAQKNPDLFWGLRGGGGNFGVVTELELRLHRVGPTIYGGMLMYPRDRAVDVCRNLRAAMADAPRGVAAGAVLMTAPPAPFVPPSLQGRPAVAVLTAYFGDVERGPEVLADLREPAGALVDTLGPLPYLELQTLTDPGNPPGRRNYWTSDLFDELPDAAIDAFVAAGDAATSPASVMILAPWGGAVADVPEHATPLGGREASWFYHCYGIWAEGEDDAHVQWVKASAAALRPWTTTGMALNFFTHVDEDRVRLAFGEEKYARLVALKDRYDPQNIFCRNQNIRPSAS